MFADAVQEDGSAKGGIRVESVVGFLINSQRSS
jgi:hypothetical protein